MPSFTPFSPNTEGKQAERLRKFLESNVPSTRDRGPAVSHWTLPSNLTQVSTFYIPSDLITFPACQRTCFLCHNRYNRFQEGAGLSVLVCPNVVMFPGVCMEIVGIVNVCVCAHTGTVALHVCTYMRAHICAIHYSTSGEFGWKM